MTFRELTQHPIRAVRPTAHLDSAHVGDIVGALGTLQREAPRPRSLFRRLMALLAILGPGLIVMVGDNDVGGVSTYTQAGQNYGSGLLWTLVLLVPVLIVNQEMAARLGVVTGVGHARLIIERFGRFWGAFSVGDLFLLNFLTIVTEFIGVDLVARYFGISPYLAVPLVAAALVVMTVTGSFRRWERAMYVFVAFNFLAIPLALMAHPKPAEVVHGFVPQLPGGMSGDLLLLIVGIVGTTVAPWQLFFQQSNVIDKRITPRWLAYERMDTVIGSVVVVVGAAALMMAAAFAFAGTPAAGHYHDAATTAALIRDRLGPMAGTLFSIVLLNAALIGAAAVTLATSYAFGDVFKARHSLHRSWREARFFYLVFAGIVATAAGVVLIPRAPLGVVTLGVQALAGVLLPSASVFLLLLANDRAVLGPWANPTWLNVLASVIVGVLVMLSAILGAVTLFPGVDVGALTLGLGALVAVTLLAFGLARLRSRPRRVDRVRVDRVEVGEIEEIDRLTWQMPPLETLSRPEWSLARKAGVLALRAYLVLAVLMVVVKVVQVAMSGGAHA
jgi:NRAMP (natural resistance-associated macrophage protein)-like metal ion transporter